MKKSAGLALLLCCLMSALPAMAQDVEPRIFPYDTHVETLDNGLTVILVPMSSGGLVSYWTLVRTGARDEYEPGRTGFAHFFEHMMFRGTEKYPAEVYNELITKIGADVNAFTTDDFTGYHLNVAADDLETVMDFESDRFLNLSYPEGMFKTEAGAVYGEYRKNRTNPFFTIYEAIHKEAFEKHTYGHTAMGYEPDIKAMPTLFDYSKTFFSRYYRPESSVLMIVGSIDVQPTMELARKYYGGWQPGYVAPQITPEPPQTAEKRIDVPYEGRSLPIVWLAYKSSAFDPEDRRQVAAMLLCDLAFGETSDIHKKLVLDEQVLEFIDGDYNINRDPSLIDVLARVKDPAKVDYVISEIDRVIADARAEPPEAKRLEDLQSRLKYSFLMNLDTPSHVARGLSRLIAVTGGIDVVDRLYRTFEQVTPQDVQDAANEYFVTERRTVAVLRGES
ncbi:MAG: insulinase family protein [bacterium]|nr:insulinase family protein [bacterium]